jgi:hypothetical protein
MGRRTGGGNQDTLITGVCPETWHHLRTRFYDGRAMALGGRYAGMRGPIVPRAAEALS